MSTLESERFINQIRAQLTTTAFKPCTYFATDAICGKRKFVKGPFKSLEDANVTIVVDEIKKKLWPEISRIPMEVTSLLVDTDLQCKLGIRKSMDISKHPEGYFMIADDLLTEVVELPTKIKTSFYWSDPVTVVDWDKLTAIKHVEYNKDYSKSIYCTDPDAAIEFVFHVILSWVIGCGGDLAYSNFIHDTVNHRVYQVDNDVYHRYDWSLGVTRVANMRSNAGKFMMRFIEKKWTSVFENFCAEVAKNANGTEYAERALKITNKDSLFLIIQQVPKRKR